MGAPYSATRTYIAHIREYPPPRGITVRLLKLGPPRQWKLIRRQNWNNRLQHFQIQPIKCPVQNNAKSQLVRWAVMMFTRLRCRLNVKLKPVELSCSYGLSNNFMLHSVCFRSLVDLENKSSVRVPLVIILPECRELNHCCCDSLKKPFKRFCCFRLSQQQWFNSRYSGNITTSGTLTELLFSKSSNDLK